MATRDYKNLDVWIRSIEFVESVYRVTNKLPKEELYSLANQLKRAAVSVPSNIAEGQKRAGLQETIQFTYISLGSVAEVETQLILCNRLYGIEVDDLLKECEIISRMLTALANSLRKMK
jgi:four helix bundle protein